MQVIERDFSEFLRTHGMQSLSKLSKKELIDNRNIDFKAVDKPDEQISLTVIFFLITLIVIVIVLSIYAYNRKNNSTKEIITQNVKENGKN